MSDGSPPRAETMEPGAPVLTSAEQASAGRADALIAEHVGVTVTSPAGESEILRDVCLTVAAGQVLAVVGESGCGKSTFAGAVAGLSPRNARVSGRITLAGENIVGTSERRLRRLRGRVVGVVPQDHIGAFNPVMTIERHLTEGPRTHLKLSRAAARQRARELLEMVHLDATDRILKARPHQLSGGMRQRVMIAAAMACGPSLIVADEPTTALDVTVQASILELLAELCRTRGVGLMLISHDLSVVSQIADQVAVLYAGEVVERGRTDVLLHRPRHPYTEALLAAVPDPEQASVRQRALTTIAGRPPDIRDRPQGCWFYPRCPYATASDPCASEHPALTELAPGHWVRSFHPSDGATTATDSGSDDERRYGRVPHGEAPILRVRGLTKHYGQRRGSGAPALQDVSIEILPGQTFGLIGGSGSGKSTLAQCVLQLNGSYTGEVLFGDRALESLAREQIRALRPELQVIFQDARNSLDERFTIRDSIAEAVKIHEGRAPTALSERVADALVHVGLSEAIAARYPRQCSGGELQRVCIARALILKPRLLICDEAVSSLDVSTRAQILNLLRDLQEQDGISMLFITHDFGPVAAMSDVIGVLHHGHLVECGPAAQVLRSPTHAYTRELIAAVPRLSDRSASQTDHK